MSLLCKWFGIGCPKPNPNPPQPTNPDRWLSVDVDGPTDFTARMVLDSGLSIDGQRVEPSAPWHISFRVPGKERGGYYIQVESKDSDYEGAVVRGSIGGVSIDVLGAIPTTDCMNDQIVCKEAHYDPSDVSLEDLARIRGAMWTETLNVSQGPRPGQDTNIASTGNLWSYPPEERVKILTNLRNLGYTHCVASMTIGGTGYHNYWPGVLDVRTQMDEFLDMLQMMWDYGLAPIVFIHPDNWTFEQTAETFTPLLRLPRAQKLIRIAVPSGWEPATYEWSSETWKLYVKWGRETLPNALILLHTVCDVDAPVGVDDRGDDNTHSHDVSWGKIVPYLHGWLTQTGTYERKDGITDGKTNFQNWVDQFNPSVRGSYKDRFCNGYAGWPKNSAWGANTPIKIYAAEYLAYWTFWNNAPKEESRKWGDAALRAGADGYLDGGTLPVGNGRVPWQK